MSRVRTRFAPSPTGSLHVGNARTAVLNWLVARHHGGDFILRIEDTDAARNVEGAEDRLLADLRWLGLDWDEGPFHQSDRRPLYDRRARELLDSGAAYRCFCDPATLEAQRERARAAGRSPHYAGTCRGLDAGTAAGRARAGEAHVVRFRTPDTGEIVVHDAIRGDVRFDAATVGDFVIVRSDGVPTYNFAVVVDDADMAISHVIRGAGHLSNTPHQLLLYDALGLEPPVFAHTPTVLGEDRSKLSKRSGATPLHALRAEGLHPDGLLNYLSLLGWSSPSEDEILPRDRLVREVTLDRVSGNDVVYDPTKMRWLSGQHIAAMELGELDRAVRPFVRGTPVEPLLDDDAAFHTALEAVRSHLAAFGDAVEHLEPFLAGDTGPDGAAAQALMSESGAVVRSARGALAAVEGWDTASIASALKTAGKEAGVRGRDLYVPVRLALTGQEHGPPLPAIVAVRGRDGVLDRLDRIIRSAAT